jgi:catechol 2,3-dioxygenase-like lactoylglutathione lyase family enzyme
MNRWLGTINHASITVSDLDAAMAFFGPVLDFMGYVDREWGQASGTRLTININPDLGAAFNIWQAKGALADHPFEVYEPGLHHIAFNADTYSRVDEMAALVRSLGGTILDGPSEFPFAVGGYYAVYFLGPDKLKFEFVHMPTLAAQFA